MENFGYVLDSIPWTKCYLTPCFGSTVNPTFYLNTVKPSKQAHEVHIYWQRKDWEQCTESDDSSAKLTQKLYKEISLKYFLC